MAFEPTMVPDKVVPEIPKPVMSPALIAFAPTIVPTKVIPEIM
jgi:hypothetical protein